MQVRREKNNSTLKWLKFSFRFILGLTVLLSNNGTLLRNFSEDPLKYLRSLSGVEFTKNGDQVFNRIVEQYFTPNKTFENQLTELEQVISQVSIKY